MQKTREVRRELQSVMWEYVGIVRSTQWLKTAEWRIEELEVRWEDFFVSPRVETSDGRG